MSNTNFNLCDASDSAVIVVDIQEKLCQTMPDKVIKRLVKNSNNILTAANIIDIPVIVTEQYPKGLGATHPDIIANLSEDSKTFEKTQFSCCEAEGFLGHLNALNKHQIILIGMETHICILQTALQLKAMNVEVFVVADAVSSRARDNYEISLRRLEQAGVIITNTESVLFEWLKDSTNNNFRSISSLLNQ